MATFSFTSAIDFKKNALIAKLTAIKLKPVKRKSNQTEAAFAELVKPNIPNRYLSNRIGING